MRRRYKRPLILARWTSFDSNRQLTTQTVVMSRPLNLQLVLLLAVSALALAAPLRQRRQLDPPMGGALTGYGNLYDGYGDNDDGTGNIFSVQVSQGLDDNSNQQPEETGYGGYEDFGGYGGFENGNRFV